MPSKKLRFAGIGCQRQGWADISRIGTHSAVEMVAFCDLVAGRGPNHVPAATAIAALEVAVAADRSLATGAAVAV